VAAKRAARDASAGSGFGGVDGDGNGGDDDSYDAQPSKRSGKRSGGGGGEDDDFYTAAKVGSGSNHVGSNGACGLLWCVSLLRLLVPNAALQIKLNVEHCCHAVSYVECVLSLHVYMLLTCLAWHCRRRQRNASALAPTRTVHPTCCRQWQTQRLGTTHGPFHTKSKRTVASHPTGEHHPPCVR
jgi:hypothetical protein